MADIFISYCRADNRFVAALEAQLRDAEFQTWRDPDLRAGDGRVTQRGGNGIHDRLQQSHERRDLLVGQPVNQAVSILTGIGQA